MKSYHVINFSKVYKLSFREREKKNAHATFNEKRKTEKSWTLFYKRFSLQSPLK